MLNNQGIMTWWNLDWTFGISSLFYGGVIYDNGKITPLPTKNRSIVVNINDLGQVGWVSNRKTFLTENGETRKILDFGSMGKNNRGDIGFPTGPARNWLLRNGVYYQTFFHIRLCLKKAV